MKRAAWFLFAMPLVLSVAASPVVLRSGDPALDGKDQLLSEADFRALLAVARAHLARFHPRPSIYRVTVMNATEVRTWFGEPNVDYAQWLILKRVKNQWRITGKDGYQLTDLTNRSSQPLAVAIPTFDFMKQLRQFVTLAAASGGSAPSR
jgi:hypothetical protein